MTSPSPAHHQTKDQTDAPVAPDFAAEVHGFWEKNRGLVLGLCAAVLLAIIAFQGLGYYNAAQDRSAQEEFAKAAGSPDRLARFAAEHSGHALAAVALLQIADAKYTAGDFVSASTGYQQAIGTLTNSTLKSRARLGFAVSKLGAGDQAAAETELKAISADLAVNKSIRAEAASHLATLANEAGRPDEVRQWLDQVDKIDPTGIAAQRAGQLRATLVGQGMSAGALK